MEIILFFIALGFYALSVSVYTMYLTTHKEKYGPAANAILTVAFTIHGIAIIIKWVSLGMTPALTRFDSLSLFAWLTTGVFLFMNIRYKVTVLGGFAAPFSLIMLFLAVIAPKGIIHDATIFESYWFNVHIVLAYLGNAFFAMAFLFGLMYLRQEKYLKSHKLEGLYYLLPPLNELDDLNSKSILYGFILFTLAILSGVAWSYVDFGYFWVWKHRQVLSVVVWLIYGTFLYGHYRVGLRGRKAVLYSITAFIIVIGSFLILGTILGSGHGMPDVDSTRSIMPQFDSIKDVK